MGKKQKRCHRRHRLETDATEQKIQKKRKVRSPLSENGDAEGIGRYVGVQKGDTSQCEMGQRDADAVADATGTVQRGKQRLRDVMRHLSLQEGPEYRETSHQRGVVDVTCR